MGLINAFQTAKSEVQEIKEEITSSGMWTVPEGVTEIEVRLFGGGGGGGGSSSGGGGGYMAYAKMTVTPGTQYAITIGAGGAADTAGGATSFGTSLTAQGGQPGTSTGGGNGGSGGGCAVRSDKARYGGNGQYGGGGGGYGHYSISGVFGSDSFVNRFGHGGVYGGNGAQGGPSSRYRAAEPGINSNGGKNYCSYDNTNNGTSTNKYYGAGGGGGYKANGGDAYAMDSSERVNSYGSGGGGGWEGGDGGSGGFATNGGDPMGGGGGGYGPLKLAEDGKYKDYSSDKNYKIGGRGGLGYGAGGGGAAGAEERLPGAGAPGICIIKYKAVT